MAISESSPYRYSDLAFTVAEWNRRQAELAVAEDEMKAEGQALGWKFESSPRHPQKSLRKRRLFTVRRIVVFLRPAPENSPESDEYELGVSKETSIPGLYAKTHGYRSVARFSPAEVQDRKLFSNRLQKTFDLSA